MASGEAQVCKSPELLLGFSNNQTALPFGSFARLISGPYHPGIEVGYGFNWRERTHFDFFQRIHAGYMYHRFAQHGIPVYTIAGIRYKAGSRLNVEAGLGGGYFHAIPATAVVRLNEKGEYVNGKGIGRPQAMIQFELRASYLIGKPDSKKIRLFASYKQRLQTPFVKSYVPLLPYNILEIGIIRSISSSKK